MRFFKHHTEKELEILIAEFCKIIEDHTRAVRELASSIKELCKIENEEYAKIKEAILEAHGQISGRVQ